MGGQWPVEAAVEAARDVLGHGQHGAGRARQHAAHLQADRAVGQGLVRANHQRRTAQRAREASHEARSWGVGVHDVRSETPRGARQGKAARRKAQEVDRRLHRVEAQARLEGRHRDVLHRRLIEQLYQRTSRRTGHGHPVLALHRPDKAQQGELGTACGTGVVYEEDLQRHGFRRGAAA